MIDMNKVKMKKLKLEMSFEMEMLLNIELQEMQWWKEKIVSKV